jgi:hypothetical protein
MILLAMTRGHVSTSSVCACYASSVCLVNASYAATNAMISPPCRKSSRTFFSEVLEASM